MNDYDNYSLSYLILLYTITRINVDRKFTVTFIRMSSKYLPPPTKLGKVMIPVVSVCLGEGPCTGLPTQRPPTSHRVLNRPPGHVQFGPHRTETPSLGHVES